MPGLPRVAGEAEERWGHLGQHPLALRHLVARVQRRELDRDAGRVDHGPAGRRPADRGDRVVVGGPIAGGIGCGARGLAEHVVGMALALPLGAAGAFERLVDRAPHDELAGEDAHRRA